MSLKKFYLLYYRISISRFLRLFIVISNVMQFFINAFLKASTKQKPALAGILRFNDKCIRAGLAADICKHDQMKKQCLRVLLWILCSFDR